MDLDVTTLVVGPFQQNCRVLKDTVTGEGIVIDPGAEAPRVLDVVARMGVKIRYVLGTHAHLDHVAAVQDVKDGLDAPFALHAADFPILQSLTEHGLTFGISGLVVPEVEIDLEGKEALPFADGEIRLLHTPGHTPGGVTFLFGHQGFFGDTLFQGSIGRTDLGGNAQVYARTLRETVLALPDDVVVYAGHGPDTTIGEERRTNPFLNGQVQLDDPRYF